MSASSSSSSGASRGAAAEGGGAVLCRSGGPCGMRRAAAGAGGGGGGGSEGRRKWRAPGGGGGGGGESAGRARWDAGSGRAGSTGAVGAGSGRLAKNACVSRTVVTRMAARAHRRLSAESRRPAHAHVRARVKRRTPPGSSRGAGNRAAGCARRCEPMARPLRAAPFVDCLAHAARTQARPSMPTWTRGNPARDNDDVICKQTGSSRPRPARWAPPVSAGAPAVAHSPPAQTRRSGRRRRRRRHRHVYRVR